MRKKLNYIIAVLVIAGAALSIWYFVSKKSESRPQPPMQQPPAVPIALPEVRDVEDFYEFTGNVEALKQVDIRARVEGFLLTVDFNDGQHVNQGELLFTIEPNEYIDARDQVKAQLLSDEAALLSAQLDYERMEKAIETNAVSKQQLTTAKATLDKAQAQVIASEARLSNANLNLSYTRIPSPLKGKISRRFVDPGNLVGPGYETLLATVVETQPIYVYFNVSEVVLQQYFLAQNIENPEAQKQEVQVGFPEQQDYPFHGFLDFIDNKIDPNTGTILMRAQMPNEEEKLFPGMFVRVRLPSGIQKNSILVREKALNSDIGGKYLFTVDPNNIVHTNYVKPGRKIGDFIVILSGLNSNQKYVLSGFHLLRPGLAVTPMLQNLKSQTKPLMNTEKQKKK
jgi:multidrug efflux system membrane fusion protein